MIHDLDTLDDNATIRDGDGVRVRLRLMDAAAGEHGAQAFVDAVVAAQPRHAYEQAQRALSGRRARSGSQYLSHLRDETPSEPGALEESEQRFSKALQHELTRAERKFGEKARSEIIGRIVGLATANARASWLAAVQEVVKATEAGGGEPATVSTGDAKEQGDRVRYDAAVTAASHRRTQAWRGAQ